MTADPDWAAVLRARTELGDTAREHLRELTRQWSLLADLSLSDLVMFVRAWDGAGWFVAAHVRPATAATALVEDPVHAFLPRSDTQGLEQAYGTGRALSGHGARLGAARVTPVRLIPVRCGDQVVAVLGRYSSSDPRRFGELEREYRSAAGVLFRMVLAGQLPMGPGGAMSGAAPRVGDGYLRLDAAGAIRYASPNARSSLRRYGIAEPAPGLALAEVLTGPTRNLGAVDQRQAQIAAGRLPGEAEFASKSASVLMRAIPLPGDAGAAVLLRDVSDLRRQEQALLSKDATIREIHHRVKNNLQTVAALLRLQARRMPSEAGRVALLDAVARVGTIALVHDSLSRASGEQVDFDEIVGRVLAMARDAGTVSVGPAPTLERSGGLGVLPATVATPLAMVLAELLLNAVEHSQATVVRVRAQRDGDQLLLVVTDDGIGFDPVAAPGLGLQIVATLVTEQLRGDLSLTSLGRQSWPAGVAAGGGDPGARTTAMVRCPVPV